ncbi:MAG: shikimate dehydrogenase [Planctomycetia bacterium]|jgi:shikimate dehydrogenase
MSSSSLQPVLALLGYPIEGNPTQYITEKAFRDYNLDWRYLTLEVSPENLEDAVRGMRAMGFAGGNITPPHERPIVEILDRLTPAAELIAAVNLLKRDSEGLIGENTEGKAVTEAIAGLTDLAEKKAVVLGAGRIARAICVELALAGVGKLTIVNRSEPKALALAQMITEKTQVTASGHGWEEPLTLPEGTDFLIHATSLSQEDPDAQPDLDWNSFDKNTLVVDVTIDPPRTELLRRAKVLGCATIDGPSLLVRQAAVNIRLWTGVRVDPEPLREALEEFLGL